MKHELKLHTSIKAIDKALADIKVRGNDLQRDMHVAACSVLQHLGKYRDMRVFDRLMDAMPDMSRKNSLVQWFETFGALTWDAESKTMKEDKAKQYRLGDAMVKPFWKFKAMEGTPYQPLVMDKFLDDTIKKLTKDAKEAGVDHSALIKALTDHKMDIATKLPN